MVDKKDTGQGNLNMDRPGDKLRRAREAQGLSLQEVAVRTRVPIRQLEVLERNEFSSLPGIPYAVGFARAYARALGMDEAEIAADVRGELGPDSRAGRYEAFEPADPARVPPRALAWTAAVVALLIAIGYGVWRTQMFTPPTDEQIAENVAAPAAPRAPGAAPSAAPATPGPVVLTATDAVWLRIYDEAGTRLLEKEMAKGESFTVPANANNPMILTGRPDALAVTVGGKPVPALGTAERTISDMPISAAALLARPAPAAAPSPPPGGAAPR
jgi:cytoskeleton protein RodZ